ncbi:hypothetical protein BLS_000296 [Venturia inaequalis]|uniref:Uncharacterized protein n=1 Tax=Venturia inaequalis TaxID=5025 RepID=A0A8H3U323_VENIN|nr:hypothetical protein BLS_000296 [Venturia inaequalis]
MSRKIMPWRGFEAIPKVPGADGGRVGAETRLWNENAARMRQARRGNDFRKYSKPNFSPSRFRRKRKVRLAYRSTRDYLMINTKTLVDTGVTNDTESTVNTDEINIRQACELGNTDRDTIMYTRIYNPALNFLRSYLRYKPAAHVVFFIYYLFPPVYTIYLLSAPILNVTSPHTICIDALSPVWVRAFWSTMIKRDISAQEHFTTLFREDFPFGYRNIPPIKRNGKGGLHAICAGIKAQHPDLKGPTEESLKEADLDNLSLEQPSFLVRRWGRTIGVTMHLVGWSRFHQHPKISSNDIDYKIQARRVWIYCNDFEECYRKAHEGEPGTDALLADKGDESPVLSYWESMEPRWKKIMEIGAWLRGEGVVLG